MQPHIEFRTYYLKTLHLKSLIGLHGICLQYHIHYLPYVQSRVHGLQQMCAVYGLGRVLHHLRSTVAMIVCAREFHLASRRDADPAPY